MAKMSGLVISELVERHEKRLTDSLLMTPRHRVAGDTQQGYEASGINTVNNRLTSLGVRLCRNIELYKMDLEAAARPTIAP